MDAIYRFASIIIFAGTLFGSAPGYATKSTDFSDLWWIPTESGWGIQLVQQETTIFATMFVYGPNANPTWYTATLTDLGSLTWSGTIYATTGPWFGTAPFDPNAVTRTEVGSMNLSLPFVNQGTLVYTVNGVQVTKTIQRQTLVTLDLNYRFSGIMSQNGTGAACNSAANTNGTPAQWQITQTAAAATVTSQTSTDTCTFSGSYGQGGHFSRIKGVYNCNGGDSGTFDFTEIAVSWYDLRARTLLTSNAGCTWKGYFSGLTQPPPPQ